MFHHFSNLCSEGHGGQLFDPKSCGCQNVSKQEPGCCMQSLACKTVTGVGFVPHCSAASTCVLILMSARFSPCHPRSVLVISKSITHVTFIVKNLVTVEDVLPVDGAWVHKPVPPAGRMKGEMPISCISVVGAGLMFPNPFHYGLRSISEAVEAFQVYAT